MRLYEGKLCFDVSPRHQARSCCPDTTKRSSGTIFSNFVEPVKVSQSHSASCEAG